MILEPETHTFIGYTLFIIWISILSYAIYRFQKPSIGDDDYEYESKIYKNDKKDT